MGVFDAWKWSISRFTALGETCSSLNSTWRELACKKTTDAKHGTKRNLKEQNAGPTYRKHRQQLKICPSSGRCCYLYSRKVWKPLLKIAVCSFPRKELRRLHPSLIVWEGDEPPRVSSQGEDGVIQLSDERTAVSNPWQSTEQQLLTGQMSWHAPHLHCSWWCQRHRVTSGRFEQHLESSKTLL